MPNAHLPVSIPLPLRHPLALAVANLAWAAQCPLQASSMSVLQTPSRFGSHGLAPHLCRSRRILALRLHGLTAQQDGGASAFLGGHRPVMAAVEHLLQKGVIKERFQFSRTIGGSCLEVTIHWLLIGPCISPSSFVGSVCSVLGSESGTATLEKRGEFLLQLGEDWMRTPEFLFQLDEGLDEDTPEKLPLADYLRSTPRPALNLTCVLCSNPLPSFFLRTVPATPAIMKALDDVSVRQAANAVNRHIEEALRNSPASPLVFWEVYAGSAGLCKEMDKLGQRVRTFDPPEWDFTEVSYRRKFRQLLEAERPHAVWLAPPCPKWSLLQNLTARDETRLEILRMERQHQHSSHLKMSRQTFDYQSSVGMVSVVEHPNGSLAWKTPAFKSIGGFPAVLRQCAVGARHPDQRQASTYQDLLMYSGCCGCSVGLWWVVLLPRRKTEGFYIAASSKNGGFLFHTEGFYCCLAEKRRAFEGFSCCLAEKRRAFAGFYCCLAEKRRAFISDCWSGICFGSQRFDCCFWLCQWWVSPSFQFSDKKLSGLFFPCWCPVGLWWVSRLVSCCLAEKLGGCFRLLCLF